MKFKSTEVLGVTKWKNNIFLFLASWLSHTQNTKLPTEYLVCDAVKCKVHISMT